MTPFDAYDVVITICLQAFVDAAPDQRILKRQQLSTLGAYINHLDFPFNDPKRVPTLVLPPKATPAPVLLLPTCGNSMGRNTSNPC